MVVFKDEVKNIQVVGYNGAHMVIRGPYCQRVVLGSLIVCFYSLEDGSKFFF